MTSWRYLAFFISFSFLQVGNVLPGLAQNVSSDQGNYLLGSASTGGTYHPVGVALSTLIKLKLLPNFDIDLTAVNTDGSQQNADLLRQNNIQFGIISALAGHEARNGIGQFAEAGPDDSLQAITTLWLSTDHLLIRDDDVKSGTINDFLDLKGRPVSLGRRDSGTLISNQKLLSALGIDIDQDFNLVELGYSESGEALASGQIDGMSVSGGVPIGAVQDVFEQLGDGVSALEINDEQLSLIDGGRGLWQRVVIPSGTYPGQDRDIFTIGTPNILAVRSDMDEEAVYQITRTIFEELDYLHGLHNTTRQISLDNAVNNLPLPIHAGAERYFKEKGVELPLPPIQLSPDLLTRYPSIETARADANEGVVTLFSGAEGDTSTQVASELSAVLSSGADGVRLLSTNGGGIGRNLTDLLYLRGVDTAIVRADTLNYARDQGTYPSVENQVNFISEMFPEEVHLLAGPGITDFSELTGQVVNMGAPSSGTSLTASIILSQLGLRAETSFFEPRIAIEKLKQGEIAAAFFIGGKPMPLLRQIDPASGLKLIAIPAVEYFSSYVAADIHGTDYPNLMLPGDTVSTVAARTALMTYAWRPGSARFEALGNMTNALFSNLLTLHAEGYHPKWREIDPTAELEGWSRFGPASLWLDDNQGTARRIANEGQALVELERSRFADTNAAVQVQPAAVDGNPSEIAAPDNVSDEPVAVVPEPEAADAAATDAAGTDAAIVPEAGDAATDAATVPAAPVIELAPTPQAGADETELLQDGLTILDGGTGGASVPLPPETPALPTTPTVRGNTPTF